MAQLLGQLLLLLLLQQGIQRSTAKGAMDGI